MGTRHLVAVVSNKKVVVAQYGQWDGYLSGQGQTVFDFIKKFLNKKLTKGTGLDKFKERVAKCKFLTNDESKQTWVDCGHDPKEEWVTSEVANKHKEKYPGLSRDTGAEILEMIYKGEVTGLVDSFNFGADSLFCEFAYVLDLDNECLEFYTGFNKTRSAKGRFAKLPVENPKYDPVSLFKKIDFEDCTAATLKKLERELNPEEEANA